MSTKYPYQIGYDARIAGSPLDESKCDQWVAGWYDADSNVHYIAAKPLPSDVVSVHPDTGLTIVSCAP